MGNVEFSSADSPQQFCTLTSRVLDLGRSLTYEEYKEHIQGNHASGLSEFPEEYLQDVSFYEKLLMPFNSLREIPDELPLRIPHLTYLDLSFNRITTIPQSLGLLFQLRTLLLKHNRIKYIPDAISCLVKLEMLDLSHNCLKELPESIGQMESLQKLNVSDNDLKKLPVSLGESKTLRILIAFFNKCAEPPQSVCNQGTAYLLSYLSNQTPTKCQSKGFHGNVFPRKRGEALQCSPPNPHSARAQYVQTQTDTLNTTLRVKTPLRPPSEAKALAPDDLVDHITGCIYGAAIGDAIGLSTEFMVPDECQFYYEKDHLSCENIIQDRHRAKWARGDWTKCFDLLMLVLDCILAWAGVVDELEFAKALQHWSQHGFPDLPNHPPRSITGQLGRVISHENFASNPHSTAKSVWEDHQSASNGAVIRTPILGITHFYDLNEVVSNTVRICKATNFDPRCQASCVAVCVIIALVLQGGHNLNDPRELEMLLDIAKERAKAFLTEPDHLKDFSKYFSCKDYCSVECCEARMTDYTLKPLGCAIAAFRSNTDFKTAISDLVMEGGHTCCNAIVTGAVLGCKVGYSCLPSEWIQGMLPRQTQWLNQKINSLLDMMALP